MTDATSVPDFQLTDEGTLAGGITDGGMTLVDRAEVRATATPLAQAVAAAGVGIPETAGKINFS